MSPSLVVDCATTVGAVSATGCVDAGAVGIRSLSGVASCVAAPPLSIIACMSFLVIRPCAPEPLTVVKSDQQSVV